jgi:hypothetical protein
MMIRSQEVAILANVRGSRIARLAEVGICRDPASAARGGDNGVTGGASILKKPLALSTGGHARFILDPGGGGIVAIVRDHTHRVRPRWNSGIVSGGLFVPKGGIAKRQANTSCLHHGHGFSSDSSGDGPSCKVCHRSFDDQSSLKKHSRGCVALVECKHCGVKVSSKVMISHLKEKHPIGPKGAKGKAKVKIPSSDVAMAEAVSLECDRADAANDVIAEFKAEADELRGTVDPILVIPPEDIPKPPTHDVYGTTLEPPTFSILNLGDSIFIADVPTEEAVNAMWSNWWSQVKTHAKEVIVDTVKGVATFVEELPMMVEMSLGLDVEPITGDMSILTTLSVEDRKVLKRIKKLIDSPATYGNNLSLSRVISSYHPEPTIWGERYRVNAQNDSGSHKHYWSALAHASFHADEFGTDFEAMLNATLYKFSHDSAVNIATGLHIFSMNYSATRHFNPGLASNVYFQAAGENMEKFLDVIDPRVIWDTYIYTRSVTSAKIRATAVHCNIDMNERPLILRKNSPAQHSPILRLDPYLEVKLAVDDRWVFNESMDFVYIDNFSADSEYWNACMQRVHLMTNGRIKLASFFVKPGFLQEANIPSILLSEETGRNFRNQIVGTFRGSDCDAGLGEMFREGRRVLSDSMALLGMAVENRWASSVFDSAPAHLK